MTRGERFPFCRRRDLIVQHQDSCGSGRWTVKDPLRSRYFEFQDHEYRVLQLLDGAASLTEIRDRVALESGAAIVSLAELREFVLRLYESGLVHCELPGEGQRLYRRLQEQERRQSREWLNLLCVRFSGVDPDQFLQWVLRRVPFLFSPGFVCSGVLLIVMAALIVLMHFAQLQARLPSISAFLATGNLPGLLAAVSVSKVLHELGHALTCRKLGRECHDLGVMFLFFVPCLYCDVSDSWMLRRRWERIAVAAAGSFVDLLTASVFTFLWWFSQPGWFHTMCLNLMIVCSVSTIAVNANPLLRFDGYFILSDLTDVPNLFSRASAALRGGLLTLMTGARFRGAGSGWQEVLLSGYAFLSLCYRGLMTMGIYLVIELTLVEHGLQRLAPAVALLLLAGVLASVAAGIGTLLAEARRLGGRTGNRRAAVPIVAAAITAFVLFWPIPRTIRVSMFTDLANAQELCVCEPARLSARGALPEELAAGTIIAEFDAPLMQTEAAGLHAEIGLLDARIAAIRASIGEGLPEAELLPALIESAAAVRRQLAELQVRERRLTVRADSDGCFFDPQEQFSTPTSVEPDELPNWDGYPLDAKNCGAVLPAGTVIGRISPPGAMVARMAVSEADLGEVRIGQRVRLISEQSPSRLLFGTVTDISPRVVDPDEVRLMLLWQLPFIFGADGRAMLEQPYHEVVARIEGRHDELRTFVPGIAGIEVRAESLSARMLRFCQQTFRPVY